MATLTPTSRMSRVASPRDPGRYGPGSEAWRLNREAMLLLGAGPRALLLQLAHPAVAAGVADHSDFRADPWRRLAGTLRSYLTIVYGTSASADAEIRRLNRLHRGIVGPGYSARDPALSMWVHATLVDSTIAVYDAWLEPLSRARRAAFYAETRPIGRAFGVPEDVLPADVDAFEGYLATMLAPGGPVRVSAVARELAGVVLRPPLAPLAPALGWVPPAAYAWTLVAVGRAASGERPRGLRVGVGCPRTSGVGLACRRLARLATAAACGFPADAQGARRGPADGDRQIPATRHQGRTERPRRTDSRPVRRDRRVGSSNSHLSAPRPD